MLSAVALAWEKGPATMSRPFRVLRESRAGRIAGRGVVLVGAASTVALGTSMLTTVPADGSAAEASAATSATSTTTSTAATAKAAVHAPPAPLLLPNMRSVQPSDLRIE